MRTDKNKTCNDCGQVKPIWQFTCYTVLYKPTKARYRRYRPYCLDCASIRATDYHRKRRSEVFRVLAVAA